jgi:hypothetical protein
VHIKPGCSHPQGWPQPGLLLCCVPYRYNDKDSPAVQAALCHSVR